MFVILLDEQDHNCHFIHKHDCQHYCLLQKWPIELHNLNYMSIWIDKLTVRIKHECSTTALIHPITTIKMIIVEMRISMVRKNVTFTIFFNLIWSKMNIIPNGMFVMLKDCKRLKLKIQKILDYSIHFYVKSLHALRYNLPIIVHIWLLCDTQSKTRLYRTFCNFFDKHLVCLKSTL